MDGDSVQISLYGLHQNATDLLFRNTLVLGMSPPAGGAVIVVKVDYQLAVVRGQIRLPA